MSQKSRIRWLIPERRSAPFTSLPDASLLSSEASDLSHRSAGQRRLSEACQEMLYHVGVPVPEGDLPVKEYAISLLKIAAEVEHALMAQYLYAAHSIDPANDNSGENYTVKVMRVAIQEMGHLITVQNLLLLTGGVEAFHMQRDTLRRSSPLNPIPFVLEPVGLPSLAKFVVAEMPVAVPPARKAQVDRLVQMAAINSGTVPHRVGAIYAVLKWLFLPKETANDWLDLSTMAGFAPDYHLTDADLMSAAVMDLNEAHIHEWSADLTDFILETPRTCAATVNALTMISEQGEGLTEQEDSHFFEFLELTDALEAGKLAGMIRPLSKSPTITPGHGGEQSTPIMNDYTQLWGEVFSLQYTLLTLSIYHALVTPRPSDDTSTLRGDLAGLALRGMRKIVVPIASILSTLPIGTDPSVLCGPPYDLDPAMLTPGSASVLAGRHLSMLQRLSELYDLIEADPSHAAHPPHAIAIQNLRRFDQRRRDVFSFLNT